MANVFADILNDWQNSSGGDKCYKPSAKPRTDDRGFESFAASIRDPDEYDAYEFADDMFTRMKHVSGDPGNTMCRFCKPLS